MYINIHLHTLNYIQYQADQGHPCSYLVNRKMQVVIIRPTESCYACQWLDNVDMHTYAEFDQNILCGSSVMSIFTIYGDLYQIKL